LFMLFIVLRIYQYVINEHHYCQGPNTGVPNEVELITIKR